MSYTITYTGTKAERMIKGLDDARDYLGERMFDRVLDTLLNSLNEGRNPRQFVKEYRLALSFVGLQGVPARAIALLVLQAYRAQ